MIVACLNGDRRRREHPGLPVTPAELAAAARDVALIGVEIVHLHPRGADGLESFGAADVSAAVRAVRDAAPGVRVSVSTREGVVPDLRERLGAIASWPGPEYGGPDSATVNWHEPGAVEVARTLRARGIGVEAGIWTPRAATAFVASSWPWQVERVLVELVPGVSPGSDGVWSAERVLAALGKLPAPVLVHGEKAWAWPVLRWAREAGYAVRIGFEDTLVLPSGREARDNAELVTAARTQGPGVRWSWPVPDPT